MYCSNCGKEIDDKAIICPHCGCQTKKHINKNNNGCLVGCVVVFVIIVIIGNILAYSINNAVNQETGQNSSLLYKITNGNK